MTARSSVSLPSQKVAPAAEKKVRRLIELDPTPYKLINPLTDGETTVDTVHVFPFLGKDYAKFARNSKNYGVSDGDGMVFILTMTDLEYEWAKELCGDDYDALQDLCEGLLPKKLKAAIAEAMVEAKAMAVAKGDPQET